jgi:hypothetical protein
MDLVEFGRDHYAAGSQIDPRRVALFRPDLQVAPERDQFRRKLKALASLPEESVASPVRKLERENNTGVAPAFATAATATSLLLAPPSAATATDEAPADAAPAGEGSPLDALTAPAPAADVPADAPAADAKPAEEKPADEKPAAAPAEDADK